MEPNSQNPSRREFLRLILVGTTALVLPSALAGCAGTASARERFTVEMTDQNRFDPANLTVPKGSIVVWKNASKVEHTVTTDATKATDQANAAVPAGAQAWDSGDILAGESYQRPFDVPGTYRYFCRHHESAGMVGTIIVTG